MLKSLHFFYLAYNYRSKSLIGRAISVTDTPRDDVTILLHKWTGGDREAGNQLYIILKSDLARIAARCLRRERPNHTVQRSDLVNECFANLLKSKKIDWRDRGHFFAIVTVKMRRYLIDYARKRGDYDPVPLEGLPQDLLARRNRLEKAVMIDKLLDELEEQSPKKCSVVVFRSYLGLSTKETADKLDMTEAAVEHEWHRARRWLFERLSEEKCKTETSG
jgi:RNA polymerase sigma factor (TIGR02999 family)